MIICMFYFFNKQLVEMIKSLFIKTRISFLQMIVKAQIKINYFLRRIAIIVINYT
jgi:hypothetical protein